MKILRLKKKKNKHQNKKNPGLFRNVRTTAAVTVNKIFAIS